MVMDLPQQWRTLASTLERFGAGEQATTLRECAAELERSLRAAADEPLTLEQAACESGYAAEYLGQLVREGKIPNAGKERAPRILRRDLPRKPGTRAEGPAPAGEGGDQGAGVAGHIGDTASLAEITRAAIRSRHASRR